MIIYLEIKLYKLALTIKGNFKLKLIKNFNKIIIITKFAPINSNINSKSDELLESCDANQQPSTPLKKCEGSETNS